MTLRHLRIYVAVCFHESITKAAQSLYLAQPAVSLAIKELEEYYGIQLFDRISRKLYLTESGKQFLDYASHIVSLFDTMETNVKNWNHLGNIRIGSSVTIGNFYLPKWVAEFEELHPDCSVSTIIENSAALEDFILKNEIDLAMMEGTIHHKEFISIPIKKDSLVLICSHEHPFAKRKFIHFKELENESFLLREKGSSSREIFDSLLLLHDVSIQRKGHSISTKGIAHMVSKNLCLSILPKMLLKEELKQNIVVEVPIHDIPLERTYTLIYHRNKYIPPLIQSFIDLVLADNQN